MKEYELPLYELFTRLRQAGLPLGIDEYELMLHALQGGFGLPDRGALARLCKTLWVKSPEEERIFGHEFEQMKFEPTARQPAASEALSGQVERKPTTEPAPPVPERSVAPSPSPALPTSKTTPPPFASVLDDEVQVAKAVLQATKEDDDSQQYYFLQTDEYFPITRRQMKQSWRYLRRPMRGGPPIELDVDATINEIGRTGYLLKPVLVPYRKNRAELLLLLDQGGSMVPFHMLSRRLTETALRGGRLGKANIYYFHNCPVNYLYRDAALVEAEQIEDILQSSLDERTGVLIFSDAGAARGGLSTERFDMTKRFLHQLTHRFLYTAWLNPMPRSRWYGTTASKIMQLIPMFDLSRRGLDDAISALRGRPTSYLHFEVRTE